MSKIDTVEVSTCPATDEPHLGMVAWSVAIDGKDHGGGWESCHRAAFDAAANYVRDLELGYFVPGGAA